VVGVRWFTLVYVLATATARADVSARDADRASELFQLGRKQLAMKQIGAACTSFADSLALDPQLGTRLNLASCREQQERFSEAYELYVEAVAQAARSGKASRADFARTQMRALEIRFVRVRLAITDPVGKTIRLDGRDEDPAKLHLVPPGTIVVDVTAAGRAPFHVEKSAAAGVELTIDVPALQPTEGPRPVAPSSEPSPLPAVVATSPEAAPRSHAYLVFGGVGLALAAGGTYALVDGKRRYDRASAAGDRAGVTSAQHEADVATALAVASAVAVGIGVVLYVRSPSGSTMVAPSAGNGTVGLVVTGSL
jgi:hypothetical protein